MSHKASNWLADLPPEAIKSGAFRVLFHLCDAHNSKRDPATACFPSQETLMKATGLSNGGLNNALNDLESVGLIRRRRTRKSDGTRGPTYYILGFDFEQVQEQTPENGDGPNSSFEGEPTPLFGPNQLQPTGDKPVREPGIEPPPNPPRGADCVFEDFFEKWPNKENSHKARLAWKRLSEEDRADAVGGAQSFWAAWRKAHPTAAPLQAASYLRDRRWQDSIAAKSGSEAGDRAALILEMKSSRVPAVREQALRMEAELCQKP